MLAKNGPSIHEGPLTARVERHSVWRFVVTDRASGAVLFEGWASDADEARQRAEAQMQLLTQREPRAA